MPFKDLARSSSRRFSGLAAAAATAVGFMFLVLVANAQPPIAADAVPTPTPLPIFDAAKDVTRNPFASHGLPAVADKAAQNGPRVVGVVLGSLSRLAIIKSSDAAYEAPLGIGDAIGHARIVTIDQHEVVLSDGRRLPVPNTPGIVPSILATAVPGDPAPDSLNPYSADPGSGNTRPAPFSTP